jgi:methionine-rich copper-binding protein CopC
MKRLLSIFGLLTAALMVLMFVGCGGDDEEEALPEPTVTAISVTEGSSVAGNATIQVTFSRKVDDGSVTIAVSGATGAVTWDAAGKTATWTPSGDMPAGAHTLTVSGTAADGQTIGGTTSVNFTATAADKVPPEIVAADCVPKNGATGVDPADVNSEAAITIAFNEACKDVKVNKKSPDDMKTVDALSGDGKIFTMTFQKWEIGNEVKVEIELTGTDLAGNKLADGSSKGAYTFTTMAKEE